MGISEKIEELSKKADEKDRERARENIKKILTYLEDYDVEGLEELLSEIKDLSKSDLYKKLIIAVTTKDKFELDADYLEKLEKLLRRRMLKIAFDNLRMGGFLTFIFTDSVITFKDILTLYTFIESVYYMNLDRPANWDDTLNVNFSGLDERLIFALDDFDTVNFDDLPEPTPEYFQKLRKVRWDKKAKKLYEKLTRLMLETQDLVCEHTGFTVWNSNYAPTEDVFIQVLSACSAVNDGRLEIEAEDVVKAYKTFFKLIKTDVTKYKAIPERLQGIDGHERSIKSKGYLVCERCGGYYKLKEDESPDYFTDKCECGGRLEYKESLKLNNNPIK